MKYVLTLFPIIILVISGKAASITSTGVGGNWSSTGTWVGGVVPTAVDDVTIASGATVSIDVNGSCLSLTMNGTAIIDFPTNNRTLTVNGIMTMNGTSQVSGNNANRTLALQSGFVVPAGQQGGFSGITVTQPAAQNFTINGTFAPFAPNNGTKTLGNLIMAAGATWLASSTETYTFQGNANLTDGCSLDGSSTATIVVNGNLSVLAGVAGQHTKIGRISLTVNGTTTVAGYFEYSASAAGTKTFNNTISVGLGGTWDDLVGEDPVINCSIVNNGTWPDPTGGTGSYRVNVAGNYTFSGNGTIGMTQLRINSSSTVTNSTILRLAGAGTGNNAPLRMNSAGSLFKNGNGTSGYLYFPASTDPVTINSGTVDFSATNNTVEYSSTGNQNIYSDGVTPYYNLVCSNGSSKFVNGATIVSHSVAISGTTTLDVAGGSDLTGTANVTMTGTSVFRLSSAGSVPALTGAGNSLAAGTTIEFYRGGAQTAAGSGNWPYQEVLISGAAGCNVNMSGVSSIAGDLTINNQGLMNSNAVLAIGGTFTYSSSSGTATTFANNITTGSYVGNSGLENFNGKTLTINGTNGYWENNGATYSAAGPIVAFTTGTGQEIRGTTVTSFSSLTINNVNADVTLQIDATVVTGLTFTKHNIVTGSFNVIAGPAVPITSSSATGWIDGNCRRLVNAVGSPTLSFPVGTSTTYAPLTLTLNSVTNTTGFITASTTDGDSPDIYSGQFEPSRTVNRFWSITNSDAVTPAVAFTSATGVLNFVVADYPGALDFTKAYIRAYDNTTLTWTDAAVPVITSTATSATFTAFASANFPQNDRVDFEIGQVVSPTTITNRLANGTFNWSAASTWIQYRTGSITLTNGSPLVTGISTSFTTELNPLGGDVLMLIISPGTTYTVASVTDDTHLTLTANYGGATTTGTYGRQQVPGNNSPVSDVDAVVIGNSFLTNTATTTINLDLNNIKIYTLDVNTATSPIAQVQVLQHLATNGITVLANAAVSQPGANAMTDAWNIDAGSATVQGDLTIGSTNSTTVSRIGKVNLTSGTITLNNLKFKTGAGAGREVQAVLSMGNNSKAYLSGSVSFLPNNRGTLTSTAGATGSTFVYNKTTGSQTLAFPSLGAASFVYNNLWSENTSPASSGLMITTALTSTNVTGNIEVHNGAWMQLASNATITGNSTKNFVVSVGGTFEIITTAANPVFPTGYTFDLGTVAPFGTVIYNSDRARDISAQTYGHLLIMNNPATFTANRTYTLPNSTVTVMGDFTLGDAVSSFLPTLVGTGASTMLDVRGALSVLSGTMNAANIPQIKVGKDWANNGTFTPSASTVEFTGKVTTQLITGSSSNSFYNLTINTTNTTDIVQLAGNISVGNVLNLTKGGLDLIDASNIGRTITLTSNATAAITRTSGYIKGERVISAASVPYGVFTWNIGTATGAYVVPFGYSSAAADYVPFTMSKTTAGAGGTGFSFSSYRTFNTQNQPYPPTVTGLSGAPTGATVADRFWIITPNGYTTKPTADITFTIASAERPTSLPSSLNAQRWNPSLFWDPPFPLCGTGTCYTSASGTTVTISAVTNFSPWVVTDPATPLPIQLRDFTASYQSGAVSLNWSTESELNNDYFTVQRTSGSESFEDIVNVKGAGTTGLSRKYSAVDVQPLPGIWYYRLRQTDFDGRYTYSKLVKVEVPSSAGWKAYPNPASGGSFNVKFEPDDLGKSAWIILHDINGAEVLNFQFSSLTEREVKIKLPEGCISGVCILSIAVEQQIVRQKLVVR
ncbi:MAG: G8 domain-containing protein [Bacteroidetes bacterium]|nr:G8 domain-containing protein [Bacteroidota bacterium]